MMYLYKTFKKLNFPKYLGGFPLNVDFTTERALYTTPVRDNRERGEYYKYVMVDKILIYFQRYLINDELTKHLAN